jgi:glycosyltransferase involved in cell wall biosynthesis
MAIQLTVIIPVYNEEEIIVKVLQDWSDELKDIGLTYEIRVYNDGSKDNTIGVLKDLERQIPNLVIINKKNSGHGPTILQGYREASEKSEWVFQVDSDNEMPASFFRELWKHKDNYDFLIGVRTNREQHRVRKIISGISRYTVWSFYRKGVADVNSPYRLMRSSCFADLFQKIPADTFAPNLIISGYAGLKKLRIFQTKVHHTNRETGEVSIKRFKLLKVASKSYWQTIRFRFQLN